MELSFEQREDIGLKYVLDLLEPVSPYGAKYLRNEGFYPPERAQALERELDNVELLRHALETAPDAVSELRHTLSGLKDLSGTLARAENETLGEVELFELTAFTLRLADALPRAEALPGYGALTGAELLPVDAAREILDPSGSGRLSFYIEDSRSPALERARAEKREAEKRLRAPDADREGLLRRRAEAAREEERALREICAAMTEALRPLLPGLRHNARAAGRLDADIAKALLSRAYPSCRPAVGGDTLRLENAVNPRFADALEARGRRFTPITAELPAGVTVLTGANMGGKSFAMKTVALNLCLALMGCFVFCERAAVPLFARIELIDRDLSSAEGGLSSFGGEIVRFNAAVRRLEEGGLSFIAMDEFARGTNAREGAAIARGVVRYLSDKPAVTLLATHYDGAAACAARHYRVKGLRSLAGESPAGSADGLRRIEEAMDYGLVPVPQEAGCPRDALRICRILGMPEEILADAVRWLKENS